MSRFGKYPILFGGAVNGDDWSIRDGLLPTKWLVSSMRVTNKPKVQQ